VNFYILKLFEEMNSLIDLSWNDLILTQDNQTNDVEESYIYTNPYEGYGCFDTKNGDVICIDPSPAYYDYPLYPYDEPYATDDYSYRYGYPLYPTYGGYGYSSIYEGCYYEFPEGYICNVEPYYY
jgi:hypothetical protein